MNTIKVNLKERSYNITIGSKSIGEIPTLIEQKNFLGPVIIITDNIVRKKAKKIIDNVINKITNNVYIVTVPSSEKSKSLSIFEKTVYQISKKTKKHKPFIIALGGGVVGDLAGFIASTYRRGVDFIQIPTTLLAQVDSSIGGKVGIDLLQGKNLIGSFYQPKHVLMDIDFLKTLPKRQIKNGLAEVVKYGIIKDKGFFDFLENNIKDIILLKNQVLEKVIYNCAKIKASIVEKDERDEKDLRIILNFGHTLGHAIESASGYSMLYNHGESVAIGMILACDIAVNMGLLDVKEFIRIKTFISNIGLPTRIKNLSIKDILNSLKYDKKFIKGITRFVLPRKIGKVEIVENIPLSLIKKILKSYIV